MGRRLVRAAVVPAPRPVPVPEKIEAILHRIIHLSLSSRWLRLWCRAEIRGGRLPLATGHSPHVSPSPPLPLAPSLLALAELLSLPPAIVGSASRPTVRDPRCRLCGCSSPLTIGSAGICYECWEIANAPRPNSKAGRPRDGWEHGLPVVTTREAIAQGLSVRREGARGRMGEGEKSALMPEPPDLGAHARTGGECRVRVPSRRLELWADRDGRTTAEEGEI